MGIPGMGWALQEYSGLGTPGTLWGWALRGDSGVRATLGLGGTLWGWALGWAIRETLGLAIREHSGALRGHFWVGHSRETLGWTLQGDSGRTLWGWALQGDSGWTLRGYFGVGHSDE